MSAAAAVNLLAAANALVAVVDPQLRGQVMEALANTSTHVVDDSYCSGELEELVRRIEALRPTLLFLGLPGLKADAAVAMLRISALPFAPRVVAVSDSAAPEVILKAMRAGAVEFIFPPFASGLEAALQAVAAVRAPAGKLESGRVIGFLSAKGGCGATTLACHSAGWLRESAKKEVLLADLDFSSGIASALMQTDARYTLDDAIQNLHRLDLKMWKALVGSSPSGVDVIPSYLEPSVIPIARKLPPLLRFWRMHYEFSMIDLGRGISPALLDVLESLDTLVLVTTNEIPALRQAKQLIQFFGKRDFGANRLKLVVNRMPRRPPIGPAELEKIMEVPIYSVIPNDYQGLSEAYSKPGLMGFDSGLGGHFGAFAARLAGLNVTEKKTRRLFTFR